MFAKTWSFGIFLSINAFKSGSIKAFFSFLTGVSSLPSSGAWRQFLSVNLGFIFFPNSSISGTISLSGNCAKCSLTCSLAFFNLSSVYFYLSSSAFALASFLAFKSLSIFSYYSRIFLALSLLFLASSNYYYSFSSSKMIASDAIITLFLRWGISSISDA